VTPAEKGKLQSALAYLRAHKRTKWAAELAPWTKQIELLID